MAMADRRARTPGSQAVRHVSPRGARAVALEEPLSIRRETAMAWTGIALVAALLAASCSLSPRESASGGIPNTDSGSAAPPTRGAVVARLEHSTPSQDEYVLRATVPVPPGTYPTEDGHEPFVIAVGAQRIPAQVEVVSRYANAADGADVVELLARMERPPSAAPGSRVTYDVQFSSHPGGTFVPQADVASFLNAPGTLLLRTQDVFGNTYTADLYKDARTDGPTLRHLRDGAWARQVATHATLLPTTPSSGPTGTLPHMMGVHTYLTQWRDEPFFSLDLRVHNAHSGLDDSDPLDDPLGKVYFESLELRVPAGWVVLEAYDTPSVGTTYAQGGYRVHELVAPNADGTQHMLPAMAQMPRRLAVCKLGHEERARAVLAQENLAFVRPGTQGPNELWSWWNDDTARYFPQRHRLPTLDHLGLDTLRAQRAGAFAERRDQLAGTAPFTWPLVTGALGWAHPWGVSHGGMVSGSEIFLWDGLDTVCAASTEGYRLYEISHRMYTERQPNVLFDKNGRHTQMPSWLAMSNGVLVLPIWWYNGPMLWASDPFGFSSSPSFQRNAVAATGQQPAYEAELLSFQPIDEMHLVRYTRSPKVLAWVGNDALAKDDLRSQAEGIRFTYSMYQQDGWGGIIPTGMLAARNYVDAFPGKGFIYGRSEGWAMDVMCATYAMADDQWRTDTKPWFEASFDLVEDGQSDCAGNIQSSPLGNIFDAQYRCRQSIEQAIVENALVSARETVFGSEPARRAQIDGVLQSAFYNMVSPVMWSTALHGPWAMIATGPINMSTPPYCTWWPEDGNYGIIDGYQTWSSFAYAYEITGNQLFLNRAAEMIGGDLSTRLHNQGTTYLENRVALLALVQAGG